MEFKPLTKEQYEKAIKAGFTPSQIMQNEIARKNGVAPKASSPSTSGAAASTPAPQEKGFLGTNKTDGFVGNILDNSITQGIQKYIPGQQVGKAIGTLGGYAWTGAKELIGAAPKGATAAYDLSAPSPLQVAGDVAKGTALVGGLAAAAPASFAGALGQGAGFGFLGGAGQSAVDTSGKAIPTNADIEQVGYGGLKGATIGALASGAAYGIGKLIQTVGKKILNTSIKPSQADIKDGFKIETVQKNDLGGSLSTMYDKTEARLADLTGQLNTKLGNSTPKINIGNVYDDTLKSLNQQNLKTFGSNTSIQNAIKQLNGEIANITDDGLLTIPQAQLVKQGAGKMGAWQFGMNSPDSTAQQAVYNTFYNKLKVAIEEGSPEGVKALNQQIQELIPVQNAIIRRIPVADRNSALGLSDMVTLTASMLDPRALLGFGISLAQKEGAVGNVLMKLGQKALPYVPAIGALGGTTATGIGGPTAPNQ